jgi:hypothetical protein
MGEKLALDIRFFVIQKTSHPTEKQTSTRLVVPVENGTTLVPIYATRKLFISPTQMNFHPPSHYVATANHYSYRQRTLYRARNNEVSALYSFFLPTTNKHTHTHTHSLPLCLSRLRPVLGSKAFFPKHHAILTWFAGEKKLCEGKLSFGENSS